MTTLLVTIGCILLAILANGCVEPLTDQQAATLIREKREELIQVEEAIEELIKTEPDINKRVSKMKAIISRVISQDYNETLDNASTRKSADILNRMSFDKPVMFGKEKFATYDLPSYFADASERYWLAAADLQRLAMDEEFFMKLEPQKGMQRGLRQIVPEQQKRSIESFWRDIEAGDSILEEHGIMVP